MKLFLCLMCLISAGLGFAEEMPSPFTANQEAVALVAEGKLGTASAAWWGFNSEDVTDTLQAAIDSKANKVIVPYMGTPWIVRPLKLRGNLELVFQPGVIVLAKRGEFKGGGESLFSANDANNLTLRGYGAILRMRKKDYQAHPYEKAEWRMGVRLHNCKDVLIEGLRIESTGGDGIYIDGKGNGTYSENVTIRNVVCYDNHRQGISVISVQNLLVENCSLSGTRGTAPESGIDLEPDTPQNRLVNCVIRDCVFENNAGNAAAIYLKPMTGASEPVSITFENCVSRMGNAGDSAEAVQAQELGGWGGFTVGAIRDDGPKGTIEFINCTAENTGREGARIYDNSALSAKIRYVRCNFKNAWLSTALDYDGPRSPISIVLRRPELTTQMGGVEFVDCHVYDTADRPAVLVHELKSEHGVQDLTGTITVHNPNGAKTDLGANPRNISLEVVAEK